MAAAGYTPLLIYGSTTASNTPLAANLTTSASGVELAINAADGKLFYKDSGGVVQVLATKGTGPIGGSNTQVQYNSSGALAGSANFTYVEGANNQLTVSSSSASYFTSTVGANTSYFGTNGTGTYVGSGTNVPVAFYQNNAEQMRLTSTGLGIGTSSPGTVLNVVGTTGIRVRGANSASDGALDLRANNTSCIINSNTFGTPVPLVFQNNGTEQMRLDSSGNLGLGVTPSAWLSTYRAIDLQNYGAIASRSATNSLEILTNAFRNSSSQYIYKNNGTAQYIEAANGAFAFYQAGSGTAGNAITFTQAMTLDASGNLGVGTTSPVTLKSATTLQVSGNAKLGNANDRGLLSLGDVGSSGANCGIWRGAAGAYGSAGNWLSLGGYDGITFTTGNADIASQTERMRIDSSGDLLVGTTSNAQNANVGIKNIASGAVYVVNSGGTDGFSYYNTTAGAYRFYVQNNGTIAATNTTIAAISDQRLKENIRDLDVGLNAIMALRPRKFDWKAGKGKDKKNDRGFIAQEFEQVFPDLIDEWKDPAPEGEEPYKAVRADLIPVLVKALQELKAEVDSLKAQLKGA